MIVSCSSGIRLLLMDDLAPVDTIVEQMIKRSSVGEASARVSEDSCTFLSVFTKSCNISASAFSERWEEPLVCIQPDRIGAFDPAQQPFASLGHDREAAIGGVDMQPETVRRTEVGQFLEPVDGARAGRACVGGDGDGGEAGIAVVGHGAGERAVALVAHVIWLEKESCRRTTSPISNHRLPLSRLTVKATPSGFSASL